MSSRYYKHIPSVSDDVMENILTHLPVKSLLRFRLVQKSWNSLITTNQEFRVKHYNNQLRSHISGRNDNLLIFSSKCMTIEILTLDSSKNLQRVLHPPTITNNYKKHKPTWLRPLLNFDTVANGIVMMHILCSDGYRFLLWNPATHETIYLPDPNPQPQGLQRRQWYLGAFGFNHHSEHLKVVDKVWWDDGVQLVDGGFLRVYSSKTGSWNIIPTKFHLLPQRHSSVLNKFSSRHKGYLDGKFYWLAEEETAGKLNTALVIIAFDFETDDFTVTPVPEPININKRKAFNVTVDLIVHRNTLTLLTSKTDVYQQKICAIWSMVGQDEHGVLIWEQRSLLSLNGMSMKVQRGFPRALMTLMNGEVQGIVFGSPDDKGNPDQELMLCDPISRACQGVEVRLQNDSWHDLRVANYVESLLCFKANIFTTEVDYMAYDDYNNNIAQKLKVLVCFLLIIVILFCPFLVLHLCVKDLGGMH